MTQNQAQHWSEYWSRGCLTSLPQDFAANYDGELAAFWKGHFRAAPAAGSLIDLCTGNGAIALLAAEFARTEGLDLDITAVDAATIRPDLIAGRFPDQARLLENIRFISDCRIEDLDLEADYDLATSQYGLEYCAHEATAVRVARLLRPGGQLVLVCHSAGSDIMAFMQRERDDYQLLEDQAYFETLHAFLDGKSQHVAFVTRLRAVQGALEPRYRAAESALLRSVLEALGGILAMSAEHLQESRRHLEAYYWQLRHGMERLQDMLRVNQALAEDPGWIRVFETAGLVLQDSGEIRYRAQHKAGDYHVFRKPGMQEH
jgi:ubiquinone/menaquinone biosynthesis C-methylase UbiE